MRHYHVGSLVGAGGLQSVQTSLLQGMWDLSPQPGIQPMSPALPGRFLTTGPSGKSLDWILNAVTGILMRRDLSAETRCCF